MLRIMSSIDYTVTETPTRRLLQVRRRRARVAANNLQFFWQMVYDISEAHRRRDGT
jgi:hypothetical protein